MTRSLVMIALVFALGGCKMTDFAGVDDSSANLRKSWNRIFYNQRLPADKRWDWATALPRQGVRCETMPTALSAEAIAHFLPTANQPQIALVSTQPPGMTMSISEVNGRPVHNLDELHSVVQEIGESKARSDQVKIRLSRADRFTDPDSQPHFVDVATLVSLAHTLTPEDQGMRVSDGGNPWLVLREGGTRCHVLARVERSTGLLHVILSLGICWGGATPLPKEMVAYCDNQPLQSLSVAETLSWLYEDSGSHGSTGTQTSWANTSERPDYLVPTNYNRLYEATAAVERRGVTPPMIAAFASLPGYSYPGPAVLGDARALSMFMMRRQLLQPQQGESTGWFVFAGPALRDGGDVSIELDLGSGPRRLSFVVPAP